MNLARINIEFKKHDFLRPVPVRSFIYSPIYILSLASDLFINFLSQTLPLKAQLLLSDRMKNRIRSDGGRNRNGCTRNDGHRFFEI